MIAPIVTRYGGTAAPGPQALPAFAEYLLRLGDDALILGQRLSEWYALAPRLEDDIALLNIALDYVGHARVLLALAGEVEGAGRDEDDLAFLRVQEEFVNSQLAELPNGDFGQTIARLALVSVWHVVLYDACRESSDPGLSSFAAKAAVECRFHVEYVFSWLERLAHGTDESARRLQAGIDVVWPFAGELFVPDALVDGLCDSGHAPDPRTLEQQWRSVLEPRLASLGLTTPHTWMRATSGRDGLHLEPFTPMLAEMQHLHRAYPGASW
ncbi:1,2-phenylacetyl-CoA epoxidase subunit PaaC [Streptomyces sp. NPDC051677]|uniref:1,2-phenylacetyl-CoA epoxidase subunit PaaC n=1 Tax=Streptomyces sp. NPDC051677 TaxID=3365669 RepID=UPI0037D72E28